VVFRNAFAVPVELSDVHLVCTLEQGIDFARRSSSLTHNSDAAQRSWSSSQSRTTQTQPQQDCDPFLAQLTAATDSYDADPFSSSPYIVEHVHVTLPPGGGDLEVHSSASGVVFRLLMAHFASWASDGS